MAFSSGKNPFMDDPDDDEFLARKDGRSSNYNNQFGDPPPYDDAPPLSRYELKQQQVQQSMNRQLDTTKRCLASIYDSEQVGIATAEELVRQGEQLDNIETKTDKINADTKVSQRHLTSIKSIFGGIRNWWNGDGKNDATPQEVTTSRDRTALRQTVAAADADTHRSGSHPALRVRGDVAGFYDDDVVEFGSSGATSRTVPQNIGFSGAGVTQTQTSNVSSSRSQQWQDYEKRLNSNLAEMSTGMSHLKNLAVGLGDEISAQNDQVDHIMPKVERADTKIRDQNRQMRQILGK